VLTTLLHPGNVAAGQLSEALLIGLVESPGAVFLDELIFEGDVDHIQER
jgi:hypothetical protein